MGEEIRVTYETLFDLVRREKNREELQKLEPSFFADVEAYLTEKHTMASGSNEGFFSDDEHQRTLLQLANSCKLLRELYERRERKILTLAMIKSRAERALVDTSALLTYEQELFQKLVEVLTQQRKSMLDPLLLASGIRLPPPTSPPPAVAEPKPQPLKTDDQPGTVTVEFLAEVPKFVGKSLEIYGPYLPGQQAMLPADIAKILIEKGRAREATASGEEMDLGDAVEME